MTVKEILESYPVKKSEQMIIRVFNDDIRFDDYTQQKSLLELRKRIINHQVLQHQEEILPDIIAFDNALRNALRDLYDRAHNIWKNICGNKSYGDEISLTAKCFLGSYPKLHPIQGDDRWELWCAINDYGWNPLYEEGIGLPALSFPSDINDSFEGYIGMECPPPNWNEGLDRELTKDLHLTSAFHNIFEHMNFAITDFIYVREFETEINVEFTKTGDFG